MLTRIPTTPVRERLGAPLTYTISPSGSDFLTLQNAYDYAAANLDLGGQILTLQPLAGTHTSGLQTTTALVGQAGPAGLQIIGDNTTPANVIVSTTGADCFATTNTGIGSLGSFYVSGVELRTTTSSDCISAWGGGCVLFGNVRFGACAGNHLFATHSSFVIQTNNAYAVVGNASIHACASVGGQLALHGATVTFANAPTIAAFVQASGLGQVFVEGMTFVNGNTMTGQKFQVYTNGVIAGAAGMAIDYLPGTTPGLVASGGIYATPTTGYENPGTFQLISANYQVTHQDRGIIATAAGGNITITLPNVDVNQIGTEIQIKRIDGSANTLTIAPFGGGGGDIDGLATMTLANVGRPSVVLRSYNASWHIIASH